MSGGVTEGGSCVDGGRLRVSCTSRGSVRVRPAAITKPSGQPPPRRRPPQLLLTTAASILGEAKSAKCASTYAGRRLRVVFVWFQTSHHQLVGHRRSSCQHHQPPATSVGHVSSFHRVHEPNSGFLEVPCALSSPGLDYSSSGNHDLVGNSS
ncbi:hypothetical protein Droror1_Dr00019787 [Drosera rotundifolia]